MADFPVSQRFDKHLFKPVSYTHLNTYLWVELKENTEGKHRLFAQSYEKFRKMGDDTKGKLEEFIFSWIDDYYRGNNKVQKFFDITLSVKNHS